MKTNNKPLFVDYLTIVIKRRHFVLKAFLIVTATAVIISLFIPNQYTATATVLPPNPQQDMMFGLVSPTIASAFGGYSGITSLLSGGTGPSDLFAAILSSSRITGTIIRQYNLKHVFKVKTYHDATEQLKEITRIGVTPEGMITVSITWYDKYLAADIANSYIEELDRFNTETAMTTGKKYRVFIEKRLNENIDSLKQAENNLRKFQEEHRTIALDIELQSVIGAIAELKSQIILLEVQKAAVGSPRGASNLFTTNIDRQLSELKKQLAKIEFGDTPQKKKEFGAGFAVPFSQLPEVALQYAGLVRDVKVQEAIYELLTQQYEQAKIMEVKDTPTVQLLDKASPPEKKSQPKRARIVILAAIFSLILGVLGAFSLEWFEQIKKSPEDFKKWIDIYSKVKSDISHARTLLPKILRSKRK